MKGFKKIIASVFIMIMLTPFAVYSELTPPTVLTGSSPLLELSTDKTSYKTGEVIQFTISMEGDALIDIYMTASFPDGGFASYTIETMMPDGESMIIPLLKAVPLADIAGIYTLPLPVIPLFPEGTSEISMVLVKTGKNPMLASNWLAEDNVSFDVIQDGTIDPLFDLETKTFTAPLGDMGTLEITFGEAAVEEGTISGSVEGSLSVAVIPGVIERTSEVYGTYTYSKEEESLSLHIEGEEELYIDITLSMTEEGTLIGHYETSKGKSGDVEFNLPAAIPEE